MTIFSQGIFVEKTCAISGNVGRAPQTPLGRPKVMGGAPVLEGCKT